MEREAIELIKEEIVEFTEKKLDGVDELVARHLNPRTLEIAVLQLASESGNIKVLTFEEDAWTSSNYSKVEYIAPRIVRKGRKSYYSNRVRIANPLNYEVLKYIRTFNGVPLPEYYEKEGFTADSVDISCLFDKVARTLLESGYAEFLGDIYANVKIRNKIKTVKLHYRNGTYYLEGNPLSIDDVLKFRYIRPSMEFYYKYIYIPMFAVVKEMNKATKLLVTPWEGDDYKVRVAAMEGYRVAREYFGVQPNIEYFFDVNTSEILKRKLGKHPGCVLVSKEIFEEIMDIVKVEGNSMYEKTRSVVSTLEKIL